MNNNDPAINLLTSIKKLSSNRFVEEVCQSQFEDQGNILFEDFFVKKVKEGDVVEGVVTQINPNDVVVDVGLKSDGRISIKELGCRDEVGVGSKIRVYVERIEDYYGNVALSREKAIRDEKWHKLEEDAATQTEVSGIIKRSIKCGFIVDLGDGISAFLPMSHVDLKQTKDVKHLIDTEQKFIVLKVDKKQGNIVVSRKLVLEKLHAGEKIKFLESLNEGDIIEGKIKSITHYGVFVGIHESDVVGVVDGLLHITDISWSRVSHPSAVFTCGQTIKVKVIKIDKENAKVSLGIKQLEDNPWHDIELRYPVGSVYKGHITSIEDYGIFVELKPGIEGLVHSSEITWVKNNLPVSNLVARGQEVFVKILSIDTVKNRMSLSIKRCVSNPWQVFIDKYPPGSIVSGKIKNNTGLYISITFDDYEIDENVEGTIYAQDISWSKNGLDQIKKYSVGDIIEAKVIRANVNRARIYLGIKQIEHDPLIELIKKVKVGGKMQAIVSKREDSGLVVKVENDVTLLINQEHLPENKKFSMSEEIEVEVLGVEAYNIILSAK
ncbi:30S ribosomal protein S1 [Wolbachia endosymbiont of Onchocerca gibsoni]|uniref:30S ribosomal protein S1 n=1 Tax=Wolbachia endosymbiont of Onchocerca gibsoni TaxID=118986 RepID=UPI0023D819B3|nr:30S ribosomal protein S1 [Wolbachia endosymbiont of Onchocerca gibsoni]MDF0607943.1 30S ribosomal protein S1 [Wolbachia endosymbiont of Onchocerca gibsoni]